MIFKDITNSELKRVAISILLFPLFAQADFAWYWWLPLMVWGVMPIFYMMGRETKRKKSEKENQWLEELNREL